MTNLSKSVLEKIKNDKVVQKPKWHFLARNTLFWTIFAGSVILGMLAFSVILFALMSTEFDIFSELPESRFEFIITLLPFFWIIFFLISAGLSIWGLHHTKKGYKIPFWGLILGNLLISMTFGSAMYAGGMGEFMEEVLSKNVPIYRGTHQRMMEAWMNPEQGRLSGTVLEIKSDEILILNDFDQKTWTVDTSERTMQRRSFDPEEGMRIRIIGERVSEDEFSAQIIRPFAPPRHKRFMNKMIDDSRLRDRMLRRIIIPSEMEGQ